MQINVSQQLKSNIGTVRNYDVDTIISIEGEDRHFRGTVRLMRTDRGILARGVFYSEIRLNCSRCLSDYNHPVGLTIEEEYFPIIDVNTGISLPEPEEPGSFTIDNHNILDLSEAIRQYTVLAIPIKHLCREDCAGLCPICGANLNETTCDCPSGVIDPRWAKLKDLAFTDNNK